MPRTKKAAVIVQEEVQATVSPSAVNTKTWDPDPYKLDAPPKKKSIKDRILEVAVEDAKVEEEKAAAPVTSEELIAAAEELRTCKDEKDRLEAEAKQNDDRYNQLRKQIIPDMMRRLGMINNKGKGSFTFGGGKVHIEHKLYASVSEAGKPVLFKFLEENGAGDLIKPTVNAQTLAAYVRERRGDNLTDPPGIAIHEEEMVKLTK